MENYNDTINTYRMSYINCKCFCGNRLVVSNFESCFDGSYLHFTDPFKSYTRTATERAFTERTQR